LEDLDYADCAIHSSHPSLISSILAKNDLLADDSIILQLSQRRSDFFQEISGTTSEDEQSLKNLFLSQINVEIMFNHENPQVQEALNKLHGEMTLFLNIVKKDPLFIHILEKNEPDLHKSRIMSAKALYLQTLETQHLVNLISYIELALLSEGEGLLFLTPIHDGLLVYKKNVDRYHIEQLIKLYNKEITEDSFIQFSCGKLEKKIKGVICEKIYHSFLEKLEKFETEKEKIVQTDPEVLNRLEVYDTQKQNLLSHHRKL
jgi:hypothetical protein